MNIKESIAILPAVTYAVGDIHGCNDLLQTLLETIVEHRKTIEGKAKIIFLGDYIDRGPDAKEVLVTLWSRKLRRQFDEVIVLKGNHEAILLESVERYERDKRDGVDLELLEERYRDTEKVYGMTRQTLRGFLKRLPIYHSDGIRLFTHAGIAPGIEIDSVSEEELLWYRGPVRDVKGRLVVHGHTPVLRKPKVTKYAVNIDTLAYGSSQLTCAVFIGKSRKPTFLWTQPDEEALLGIERAEAFAKNR